MAFTTTDVYIRPEDGWVLVATNPTTVIIKPDAFHPWWVAVTAGGAPDSSLIGLPMGRGGEAKREPFFLENVAAGEVYIRVRNPVASEPASQHARFGVIVDAA